jgi:DNA polymerase-3 subunit beta
MKFKINRDHFVNGLQQVMNIVASRPQTPILGNVLIQASKDTISMTTTNFELGIRCVIKAEVIEAGGITLPVRKLASIVRELPNLDVEVNASNNQQARISSGMSSFTIMGISETDFPALPAFSDQHSYVLAQSDLSRMLKSVSYAQSTDEARYMMNGVFFNFNDQKLTLAATDGRRLAVVSKELEVSEGNEGSLILPSKTVIEVERLLNQGDTIEISFNDRQVAFKIDSGSQQAEGGLVDSVYLVSRIVEGQYPNYKQVIPQQNDLHIKINREIFLNTIKRASLVLSEKNFSVKLNLSEDLLEVTGSSPEIGEATVTQPVDYKGPEIAVTFNPQYMVDTLKALTRDEVIFEFKDQYSPGVIRTQDSFLCVIMPLRLGV